MSTSSIVPAAPSRKSPTAATRRRAPARSPRRGLPTVAVAAPAHRTSRSLTSTLSLLSDQLHAAVTSLTAALDAGDVVAARIARNAVNAARIQLDVISMIGAAS